MKERFKLPFKLVEQDNGACGDPECCGGFEEWVEILDADGHEVFNGRDGDRTQKRLIQRAFGAFYREQDKEVLR